MNKNSARRAEVYAAECGKLGEGVARVLDYSGLHERLQCRKVVVKVNFVSAYEPLSATPVEAVEELVKRIGDRCEVMVAEAPTIGDFREAIRRFGYDRLVEYGVELFDLSGDDYEEFYVWDRWLDRRVKVRVSKTILESECLVSIARPKTHDTVVVTLTVKNVVVGSILPGYRHRIHQGYKAINLSIAYLATQMMPSLALIDGFLGMEGAGPTAGSPVELGVSLGGADAVAVDAVTAALMGFNPLDVGYLYYLQRWGYGVADPYRVKVAGLSEWRKRVKRFRPHPSYERQLKWRLSERELARVEEELIELGVLKQA